jgi:hypothetical protein
MKKPVTVVLSDDTAMLANEAMHQDRSRSWVADRLLREGLAARQAQPGTREPAAPPVGQQSGSQA